MSSTTATRFASRYGKNRPHGASEKVIQPLTEKFLVDNHALYKLCSFVLRPRRWTPVTVYAMKESLVNLKNEVKRKTNEGFRN